MRHMKALLQFKPVFNSLLSSRCLNLWEIKKRIILNTLAKQKNIKPAVYYVEPEGSILTTLYPVAKKVPDLIHNITGMYQAPMDFSKQPENLDLFIKIQIKLIFELFSGKLINNIEDLMLRFPDCLKQSLYIESTFYYPLVQHSLASLFGRFQKIPPDILGILSNSKIDCTSYANYGISVMPIIETIVTNWLIKDFIYNNDLRVVMQNPSNNNSSYRNGAYAQMKQPNPDVRVSYLELENKQNKIWFYDVKLINHPQKYLSLVKGHLSLACNFKDSSKFDVDSRFRGDVKGSIGHRHGLDKNTIDILTTEEKNIDLIFKNKAFSMKKKIEEINSIRNDIDLNPLVRNFACSRLDEAPYSLAFDDFFREHQYEIKANLKGHSLELHLDIAIPKKDLPVNVHKWHNDVFKIIKSFPEPWRTEALTNYHKFKEIEDVLF